MTTSDDIEKEERPDFEGWLVLPSPGLFHGNCPRIVLCERKELEVRPSGGDWLDFGVWPLGGDGDGFGLRPETAGQGRSLEIVLCG